MKKYYAKQSLTGTELKVHVFTSMQERDAWVKEQYDALGARQCSAVEAKQLAKDEDIVEH
jgi:hypothetical protein